ncbi:DUF6777 domain-containing protein [Streptomyces sp. NPDC101150]|uniref:DUF6777 domain-containing protein n=1 Tax=Streptomyces sp. NPDC101150 TaxID=3366114 RepID=UPI00383035CF
MTSQPPPDSHPTGPPSGPLSGPSAGPPSGTSSERPTQRGGPPTEVDRPRGPGGGGPDDGGSGGGGDGGGQGGGAAGGPGGGAPWWRSTPRIAIIAAAVVAAVALTVILTRPSGNGAGEVFLQPAAAEGPDPFTKSTAKQSSPPPSPSASSGAPSSASPGTASGTPNYPGSEPGLYGGSRNAAGCDVEQQIKFLESDRAKAKAFAGAEGIDAGAVPSFLRSLTPVQLRMDTRVTNHGFKDGKATAFQSVLQAGTAVLIDSHGMPRVRCACGNPLQRPVPLKSHARTTGTAWPGYRASNTVAVQPANADVKDFILYDPETGEYFRRPKGSDGDTDRWTPPPTRSPSGTPSPGTPSSPGSSPTSSPPSSESPSAPSSAGTENPATPSEAPTGTEGPTAQNPTTASQPPQGSTGGGTGQVSP